MSVIGVDVGGTKLSVATLDGGGLRGAHVVPTPRHSGEALVEQLVALIHAARTVDTQAVGLGVPSTIEWETGRVRSSVNVPLQDVPLRMVLQERLELPVFVDNDANCAALAEALASDPPARDLVMFTVGTGVGGGLVLGGRPYRGATGAAAELGHMLIAAAVESGDPGPHPFPQPGSLESLAAGPVLDAMANASATRDPDSGLGRRRSERGGVTGVDAVELAQAGDTEANRLVALLGERLGIGIANIINIFDPEVVAIGGGVSAAGRLLLEPARETAWRHVIPGAGTRTEIRLARFGADAGVRGAAELAQLEVSTPARVATR